MAKLFIVIGSFVLCCATCIFCSKFENRARELEMQKLARSRGSTGCTDDGDRDSEEDKEERSCGRKCKSRLRNQQTFRDDHFLNANDLDAISERQSRYETTEGQEPEASAFF